MSFLDSILPSIAPIAGAALGSMFGPVGTAVGGALGSAVGGSLASKSQEQGANNAIQTLRDDIGPYRDQGINAMRGLNGFLGIGADGSFNANAPGVKPFSLADFQADPGYQFRKDEGLGAVMNKRSAMGGVLSGGTLKDLTRYGQGLASEEYGNAYNRYRSNINDIYTRLFGQETLGANAATGNATNIASLQNQIGSTNASGVLSSTNAGVSGVNNWLLANGMQQQPSAGFAPGATVPGMTGSATLGGMGSQIPSTYGMDWYG